jgi:hypothetical protein
VDNKTLKWVLGNLVFLLPFFFLSKGRVRLAASTRIRHQLYNYEQTDSPHAASVHACLKNSTFSEFAGTINHFGWTQSHLSIAHKHELKNSV